MSSIVCNNCDKDMTPVVTSPQMKTTLNTFRCPGCGMSVTISAAPKNGEREFPTSSTFRITGGE